MTVRAGRLRHRVEVVKPSQVKDEFGAITNETESIGVYWCESNHLSSKTADGTLRQVQNVVEFTTRYNKSLEDIDPTMYIKFKGSEYDIGSVINPRLLNEYLVITATRR
ncbi:hypothetical protein PE36_00075 [Moritella sp. PE36]|uniref:head-tail adaptor protein n=1 Tax=Moritella sp. PE36 TaxID=58051 RepID=UPI000156914B|nr:hypothetical protein PE36_00075 [Moritella sp. PE36]